jgi:hypothetical protein
MAFDGMGHSAQTFGREVQCGQLAAGQQGSLARSQMALGMVLGQVDQIVQIAGRHHHQRIGCGIVFQQLALRQTRCRWLLSWRRHYRH